MRSRVIDQSLQQQFSERLFTHNISDLFRDPVLCSNSLESFLGLDYAESAATLLGENAAPEISHASLREMLKKLVREQFAQTKDEHRLKAWLRLGFLLGDLRPPSSLLESIQSAITSTDFSRLFASEPVGSSIALRSATQLLRWYDDEELRQILVEQLMQSAVALAENDASSFESSILGHTEDKETITERLFEIALSIALASSTNQSIAADFAQLLERLVAILPDCLSIFAPLIQRFYEELPISESEEYAILYMRSRALMEDR